MSVRISPIPHYAHSSSDYSYTVEHFPRRSQIHMQIHSGVYTTSLLPQTYSILQKILPAIFNCECFNDLDQPFSVEVRKTEVAHLFEHILLEYLCLLKEERGNRNTVVNGVTTWDWYINPVGSFVISIDVGLQDKIDFISALQRSTQLFDAILMSHTPLLH